MASIDQELLRQKLTHTVGQALDVRDQYANGILPGQADFNSYLMRYNGIDGMPEGVNYVNTFKPEVDLMVSVLMNVVDQTVKESA